MFFLYGAGGHAKVILDILRAQGVTIDCVCDDDAALRDFCSLPVLRGAEAPAGTAIVSIGKNFVRQRIAEFLKTRGNVHFATAIHPSAIVSPSAKIGAGTVVMPGAIINAGAEIGEHVIVNTGASVDHDCRIGNFVHVAPHSTLCGNVSVGEHAWIGAGAVVVQGVSVEKNACVGAGSVVIKKVPANAVVVGVPAKVLKITPPPGRRLGRGVAFPAGFCRGKAYLNFGIQSCSAKKIAVRSRADKPKLPVFDSVNQQPVGTNVAFAKALPISGKRVGVKSFRKRFFLHKAHNRVLKKRGFQASLACEFQIALKSRAVNNFEHLLGLQIGKEFFDGFEAFRFIRSRILLNNHAVYFRHRGKCFVVGDFRAPEVRPKRKRAVVDALMQKQAHRFGHRDAEMREKLFRLRFDFGFNANTEGCGFCHDNVLRFDFFELSYNKKAIAIRFSSKERLSA